jgi:hypothetical protein
MVKRMDAIQLNFALGLSMSCSQGHTNLAALSSRPGGPAFTNAAEHGLPCVWQMLLLRLPSGKLT